MSSACSALIELDNGVSEQAIVDQDNQAESAGEQYLTFVLAGEEYGVDILRVQEIKGFEGTTDIPNTPEYVLGVVNLRGNVIPVVDLRIRFGMERMEYTPLTVVIVVRVNVGSEERTMGMVVDTISDVYNIDPDNIRVSPDFGTDIDTSFVRGLSSFEDKMIILLNIDHLLDDEK